MTPAQIPQLDAPIIRLWAFRPQEVVVDTLVVPIRLAQVGPKSAVVGRTVEEVDQRLFTLRYTGVSSSDAFLMAQFFTQVKGSAYAFHWVHPIEQLAYQVRFGSGMGLEWYAPTTWRHTSNVVLQVVEA